MLFLSAVPCCSTDDCDDEIRQEQTGGNHEHNDDCKNCSPFALCENCVGFAFTVNIFQVDAPKMLIDKISSDFVQLYFPQYTTSFWQPPKLS